MSNNPKVTVICLCYNHNDYLVDSLNSVLNQTYKNIEIIIVDDFSLDGSRGTILNWCKENRIENYIFNTSNIGNTKSFNKALKIANGEFIIDFATDDILLPECISVLVENFQSSKFKNLGVIFSNSELISSQGENIGYFFKVNKFNKTIEKIEVGNIYSTVITSGIHICQVAMLIKKSVLEELGGYDESLYFEDLDFWIRSSRIYQYDYIDRVLCKKRILKSSLSNQFDLVLNKKTNQLNLSTYKILANAFYKFNSKREEDFALLKRIHYEILLCIKTLNIYLLFKYLILEFKLRFLTKRA